MKKKLLSLVLSLAMCLGLLPVNALAVETSPPDWYFLFAIFKNVDADGKDKDGKAVHVKYSMTQDEVNVARSNANDFEKYMNSVGVMRAHVYVVEIDAAVTELQESNGGSYIGSKQAAPPLKNKVDLDRYDHVTCIVGLDNLSASWLAITGSTFEHGAGHSCINYKNREYALNYFTAEKSVWPIGAHVHEFLHFMENMTRKIGFGAEFGLHDIRINHYMPDGDEGKECYRDIMLNRAKGTAGTGVHPSTWQYPPHMLWTMTELTIPSGVTRIGHDAFLNYTNLTSVTIPSSVTFIDVGAFHGTGLTSVSLPASITSIADWTFANCSALTSISIPSSVTTIGSAAFQSCTGLTSVSLSTSIISVGNYAFANCPKLTDVYYSGTKAQWEDFKIGNSNGSLTNATIHYNSKPKITSVKKAASDIRIENGCAVGSVALNVQNDGDPSELSVYIGCYDTLGRMLGTERLGIATSVGENTLTLQLSGVIKCKNETGLQFRAFLLDNGFSPLCEAIPIKQ